MLPIGIQSRGIINENCIGNGYRAIAKSGITAVDYNIVLRDGEILSSNGFTKHLKCASQFGITFSQTHAPLLRYSYENLLDESYWNYYTNQYKKSIEITSILKAPYMVMHALNLASEVGKAEEKKQNLRLFNDLKESAKKYGVTICIENVPYRRNGDIAKGACSDAKSCIEYIMQLNSDKNDTLFGICFDTGHAKIMPNNLYDEVTLLADDLKVLHIHDNDGTFDSHQLPYSFTEAKTGVCSTDWGSFLIALRNIDFKGTLSFETGRFLSTLPGVIQQHALQLIHAIGTNFSNIISFEEEQLKPNKNKKIIIFGAGKMLKVYLSLFGEKYEPYFVVDNDKKLWGKIKNKKIIHNPQKITEVPNNERLIIINSAYYEEIIIQLKNMGITEFILSEEVLRMGGKAN